MANYFFTGFIYVGDNMINALFRNPRFVHENPRAAFDNYSQHVSRMAERTENMSCEDLYVGLKNITNEYKAQSQTGIMNTMVKGLIQSLVSLKQDNLASIMYSYMIKLNKDNPKLVKEYAINALAVAKRADDPVHIMARANDIANVCFKTKPGSEEHIKYLKIQHDALVDICTNYHTTLPKRYNTISKELLPLDNYKVKLCFVKLNLAEYTYYKNYKDAQKMFNEAIQLFIENKDYGDRAHLAKIATKINYVERKLTTFVRK